jgi:hypothetical protein
LTCRRKFSCRLFDLYLLALLLSRLVDNEMTAADAYVVMPALTNAILIFSLISDSKKKTTQPIVISDSSDMYVFRILVVLLLICMF